MALVLHNCCSKDDLRCLETVLHVGKDVLETPLPVFKKLCNLSSRLLNKNPERVWPSSNPRQSTPKHHVLLMLGIMNCMEMAEKALQITPQILRCCPPWLSSLLLADSSFVAPSPNSPREPRNGPLRSPQ